MHLHRRHHLMWVVKMGHQAMPKSWAHSHCRSFTSNKTAVTKNRVQLPPLRPKLQPPPPHPNKVSTWAPVSLSWLLEKVRMRSRSGNRWVRRQRSSKATIQNWSKPKSKWEMSWQIKLLKIRCILALRVKKIKSEKTSKTKVYSWKMK